MTVVLTGGGTGGHLTPALAIADYLREHQPERAVCFIGNTTSMEADKVPAAGYPFKGLSFYGMPRRKDPVALLRWMLALVRATQQARTHLLALQPTVVLGTGGYVSAPVLLAAKWLGIPYHIHEPDAHPGLVNRALAPWARHVTGAFPQAQALLGTRRFTLTGNPLRTTTGEQCSKAEALAALGLHCPADQRVLVVLGGSQGARSLNRAVVAALPTLVESLGFVVIHQTGDKLYEETLASLSPQWHEHPNYLVKPYYPNMAAVWPAADVALCRAGSLTLSELFLHGVPALLVPYPHAAANHQEKNARAVAAQGAAHWLADTECQPDTLVDSLTQHFSPAQCAALKTAALALGRPSATQQVASLL